jgi:serine/threonine protein kinase
MPHVQPEELQLILDGRTTSDGLDDAVEHLGTCEACLNMARAEAQTLDIVLGAQAGSTVRTAFTQGSRLGVFNVIGPLKDSDTEGPFLAIDTRDNQQVALYLERSSFEGVIGLLTQTRFWKDVRAVTRLVHPNVLRLHQAGIYKDRLFIAVELAKGADLVTWLQEAPRTWKELVPLFVEAGQGLIAAHGAGIAHGDFGLGSVLVTEERGVKVTDFGLRNLPRAQARSETGFDSLARLPGRGRTSAFMSPEQRSGAEPDALSDQFSFCVAMFLALYRQHPFGPSVKEALPAMTADRVRRVPKGTRVPRWIRAALVRGLRADRNKRWPSMAALLDRLTHPPLLGLF